MDKLFDRDLEHLVIGACLVDLEAFRTAASMLDVHDFACVDSQLIFSSIQNVFETKETVDPVLVFKDLKKRGELNRAGGASAIYELQSSIAETDSTRFYCELLSELSVKRHIDNICKKAKSRVLDESLTAAEIIAGIEAEIDGISGVSHQIES